MKTSTLLQLNFIYFHFMSFANFEIDTELYLFTNVIYHEY